MLLLMIERGMPIDMVLTADTGMEFPEMYRHWDRVEQYLYHERGLHLTILRHPKGFEWLMFDEPKEKPSSIELRAQLGVPPYFGTLRETSNAVSRDHGLSVIEETTGQGKHYAEWEAERTGKETVRGLIRRDIDAAIRESFTFESFLTALRRQGYLQRLSPPQPGRTEVR